MLPKYKLLAAAFTLLNSENNYRNSLFVRCKNIFGHRKRTKNILHKYNFTTKIFPTTAHQHLPSCCCLYILVFVVASNTTNHLLFTSYLFGTRCDLLN